MNKMFSKLGPNSAQHKSGFLVQRSGRFELKYCEKDKVMLIEVDPGTELGIYKNSIKEWQPPYDNEIISREKRVEIIHNISEALNFLGIKHEFC